MKPFIVAFLLLIITTGCSKKHESHNPAEDGTTRTAVPSATTTAAHTDSSTTLTAAPCADQNTPSVTTVAVTDTVNGPWERPMTLESDGGDDVVPCACVVIHPNFRNETTEEALQNLLKAAGRSPAGGRPLAAVIIGHGTDGSICTGNGRNCNKDDDNKMSGSTIDKWAPTAKKLHDAGFTTLRLLGCGVGAGQGGSLFIREIAKRTGLRVFAPTGSVRCDTQTGSVKLDPDVVWSDSDSMATEPAPVPPSEFVKIKESPLPIEWGDIAVKSFEILDDTIERHRPILNTKIAARQIAFDHPYQAEGEPLGVITGRITLLIASVKVPKIYEIYGDVVARDPDNRSIYYPLSSWLSDQMAPPRDSHQ